MSRTYRNQYKDTRKTHLKPYKRTRVSVTDVA